MTSNSHSEVRRLPGVVTAKGWLIAVLVGIGAAAGAAYAQFAEPQYVSQAYVVTVPQDPQSYPAAVHFAQTYSRIMHHPAVIQAVLADSATWSAGGPATMAEVQDQVRGSSAPDAPVIEVAGSASSPVRAADLANATAGGLIAYGNERSDVTGVRLALLGEAFPPESPSSPSLSLALLIGAAIGLVLAGLAAVSGVFDRVRRYGAGPPSPPVPTTDRDGMDPERDTHDIPRPENHKLVDAQEAAR